MEFQPTNDTAFRRSDGSQLNGRSTRYSADEELMTTIIGAEGLINSRPLAYLTADPSADVLTPNQFMHRQIGGSSYTKIGRKIRFKPTKEVAT